MRYSNDLRKKAIEMVNKNIPQNKVAILLNIDKSTIYRWYKKYRDEGSCKYKTQYQSGKKPAIEPKDYPKLEQFVVANSNLSLADMGRKWGNISESSFHRYVKRISYTYKKKAGYIRNETKKEENPSQGK